MSEDLTTAYLVGYHKRDDEVAQLQSDVTKYKARLQVIRSCFRETDWANLVGYDRPDVRDWFDQDGVPL